MRIDSLGNMVSIQQIDTAAIKPPVETGSAAGASGFDNVIKKAISDVNELQSTADTVTNKLAAGDSIDIHQAMIAMQKASTALQFTIQVRNKVIEAYQEIMRMQV